jgi:hypothetical protein
VIWVVIVALLAVVALAYVAAPLRRGPRRSFPDTSEEVARIGERKAAALTAILDIEEERDVGKLSVRDFELLRDQYEREALTALHELDAIQASELGDEELEAEIAAARARMVCPSCGRPSPTGGRCSRCGG